ncbi:MAG: SDR family NAD(P)-dependent oxidoreductase [Actinobacteria bacterium]|nr:SDR family NAD(P)-dependent oxidoreductase [Actinomycetota bacterium]
MVSASSASSGLTNFQLPKGWRRIEPADSLVGKHVVVTGASSGLGLETSRACVAAGAKVTMAVRNIAKSSLLIPQLEVGTSGKITLLPLDLSSLKSISMAAAEITTPIDILVLNAGVMATPLRHTDDGFELQIGTNHLGHFAFAGRIFDALIEGARVVTVSSQAHRIGSFSSDNSQKIIDQCYGRGEYEPWGAYGRSKLANLLFTLELHRRSVQGRLPNRKRIEPMAAHPGWSATNLQAVGAQMKNQPLMERGSNVVNALFAQSAKQGALPILCAATFPGLPSGSYLGPDGFLEMRGYPKLTRASSAAYDQVLAEKLWEISSELTGVAWS